MPLTPGVVFNEKDPVLSQLYEKEWRKLGHVCVPYGEWKLKETIKKKEELTAKIMEALDKMKEIPLKRPEYSRYVPPKLPLKSYRKRSIKPIITLIILLIIGFFIYQNFGTISRIVTSNIFSTPVLNCSDGTLYNQCSQDKPIYCFNGTLIKNATYCGCQYDYKIDGEDCKKIQRCNDGTIYRECSSQKPLFCSDGNLSNKASVCGCPSGSSLRQSGDNCIDLSKPDISVIERKVHELVNIERQKNGLKSLTWDDKLADIARKHSQDMAQNNFFSHDNLKGQDPTERGRLIGYYCRKDFGSYYMEGIAENLFQNNLYDSVTYYNGIPSYNWNTQEEIARSTVSGWMTSPGHRQNILTATYDKEGIGIAVSSDSKVLITQDFC